MSSEGLKIYQAEDSAEPIAEVYVEHYEHGEYQVRFRVGVQYFDIGPRRDDGKEADWFKNQFCHALGIYGGAISKANERNFPDEFVHEILTLLDRVELEEDASLAGQRHDIAEKHGFTVTLLEPVSGAAN